MEDLKRKSDSTEAHKDLEVWLKERVEVEKRLTYRRFTFRHIFDDLLEALMLNKGILFTAKELILRPGQVIKGFINTDREKYTHPVRYYILIAGAYILLILKLRTYDGIVNATNPDDEAAAVTMKVFNEYIIPYMNLWIALGLFPFALLSRLLFAKARFNYTEHLIFNLYLTAHMLLITMPLEFVHLVSSEAVFMSIYFIVYLGVSYWFLLDCFQYGIWSTLWRTTLYFIGGFVIFVIVLFFLGVFAGLMLSTL